MKLPIMPEAGQEETVRVVALDRSFHIACYKCEVRCKWRVQGEKMWSSRSSLINGVYLPLIVFIYFSVLRIILSPMSDLSLISLHYLLFSKACNTFHIRVTEGWYFLEILRIALTRGSLDRHSLQTHTKQAVFTGLWSSVIIRSGRSRMLSSGWPCVMQKL